MARPTAPTDISTPPTSTLPRAPQPSTVPAVIREPSPTLAPPPQIAPESRMLPPHQTKMERVTGHLAALSEDMREWTELRIDLVKRQVEGIQAQIERFQHYASAAGFFVPAAALALTAVFFIFIALALGVSELVGSLWGGFLLTAVLLIAIAGLLGWLGLKSVKEAQQRAIEARRMDQNAKKLTREDIQDAQAQAARRSAV